MPLSRRTHLVIGLALGAAALIAIVVLGWRSSVYSEAAYHYGHYASAYDPDMNRHMYDSCYGAKWDSYMETLDEDLKARREDRAYRTSRAEHFHKLRRKYEAASRTPWVPLTLDPPLAGTRPK